MRLARPARRPLAIAIGLTVMFGAIGPASAAISRQEAYRLAKKGKSTPQILMRAFPGVAFTRTPEAPIRVLLADEAPEAVVAGQSDLTLSDGAPDTTFAGATLLAGHRYRVIRSGTDYIVSDVEATATTYRLKGPVVVDSLGSETGIRLAEPSIIDRRYRGQLVFFDGREKTLSVNNVIDVELYLLGTLPGDMPANWGTTGSAALRAGAVALRSRALTQRKLSTAPFDFTASDPKYLGLDGERAMTTAAVQKTRRLTLRRKGFAYPASFSGAAAMGSNAFQPRPGKPLLVASGPAKAVEGAGSGKAQRALARAIGFKGLPYLWGGTSPSTGFDCSGLVYFVYAEQGVKLPRVAADQAKVGTPIARVEELLPGDAVFFADSSGYIHHMGLYIGGPDQEFVHSPRTGDVVKISSIKNSSYYTSQFAGGRRYA